jgi:hypothetical protein
MKSFYTKKGRLSQPDAKVWNYERLTKFSQYSGKRTQFFCLHKCIKINSIEMFFVVQNATKL